MTQPSEESIRAARMQRYLGDQEAARKELAMYPESVRQRLEAWQEQQGEWFSDTVLEIVAEFIKHDDARRIEAEGKAVPVKKRPHCETCGKDVPEVLCPTCAKWWHDNPPELEARATAAEAENAKLRDALREVYHEATTDVDGISREEALTVIAAVAGCLRPILAEHTRAKDIP